MTLEYDPFEHLSARELEKAGTRKAEEDLVAKRLRQLRAEREARQLLDNEYWARTWKEPPYSSSLNDELLLEHEPMPSTVDGLHKTGTNTLLTAQWKTGKTTFLLNLLRSLADGEPYLDRHAIKKPEGRIAFWNYEVHRSQFSDWARQLEIIHPELIVVLNLRGYRMPLWTPQGEDWTVQWLQDHEVCEWILDPFGRAFRGAGSENSNDDVGSFLEALDVIKARAGIVDLYMSSHTGRQSQAEGEEHVRGATVLDDWADNRWIITKEQHRRYFRAQIRGGDSTEAEEMQFDPITLSYSYGGVDKETSRILKHARLAVEAVKEHEGEGISALRKFMSGDTNYKDKGVSKAVELGWIIKREEGKKHAHYLGTLPGPKFRIKGGKEYG